jgi:succinate-semialdehyde dehydrogenase/glutarate-semialdehyde dehydrogenase
MPVVKGGQRICFAVSMTIATINPATGETLKTFEPLTDAQIDAAIGRAAGAFRLNARRSFAERAAPMRRAGELLDQRARDLGRLITIEMGKPIKASIAEVKKCALVCRYYAEHGAAHLADERFDTDARASYVRYEPLGPVLAVMPWNFPFWQVFRFAAPALMAGNAGLLKHSSNVPQCALAIEQVLRDAGFTDHEFQTLLIESKQVRRILEDERVKAATLTGSEPAGASVASIAAQHIKKSVLELGGSDPFIVMPSADIDEAARVAVQARAVNSGQSCIAAKRFIVHDNIADQFTTKFVDGMKALKVGDPLDESTDVGPLAMPQIAEDIEKQVNESVRRGAKLLTGGTRNGNFYAPTVLIDVPRDAPAACDETFGPVAAVFRVRDAAQAIALANDTKFGLASSVWTTDAAEMQQFIDGIEAGQVFVNAMVASDPCVPFGGIKHSGFGRELGPHGIREFVNAKTVWVGGKKLSKTE